VVATQDNLLMLGVSSLINKARIW